MPALSGIFGLFVVPNSEVLFVNKMTTVLKSVFVALICLTLISCTTENNIEITYNSLKEGQAKVIIDVDGKPFYPDESVFTGTVDITNRFLKLNLFDQLESNIIVAFGGENWYTKHPIQRQVFVDNQMQASVMIGKVTDKVNRYGTGYLMTDGIVSIRTISDEKLVIHFKGKVGKYETMREPKGWSAVEGDIIYKKPKVSVDKVNKKDVYY